MKKGRLRLKNCYENLFYRFNNNCTVRMTFVAKLLIISICCTEGALKKYYQNSEL